VVPCFGEALLRLVRELVVVVFFSDDIVLGCYCCCQIVMSSVR
jgi:hypothetical protein